MYIVSIFRYFVNFLAECFLWNTSKNVELNNRRKFDMFVLNVLSVFGFVSVFKWLVLTFRCHLFQFFKETITQTCSIYLVVLCWLFGKILVYTYCKKIKEMYKNFFAKIFCCITSNTHDLLHHCLLFDQKDAFINTLPSPLNSTAEKSNSFVQFHLIPFNFI